MNELFAALKELTPKAMISHEPTPGCYTVKSAVGGGLEIDTWQCAEPRPTKVQISGWKKAQDDKASRADHIVKLENRIRLFSRLQATGASAAELAELKAEIVTAKTPSNSAGLPKRCPVCGRKFVNGLCPFDDTPES